MESAIQSRSTQRWKRPCFCGVKQQEQRGLDLQDDVLRDQIKRFGKELGVVDKGEKTLSCSDGWLSGFKKRMGHSSTWRGKKRQHGGHCTAMWSCAPAAGGLQSR
jgi:hypothetical protein